MKKIRARFNSRCAETGNKIAKGEEMYYNYATKKCYCMSSNEVWLIEKHDVITPSDVDQYNNDAAYIAAQEDAYWDNLTGGYYSR